MAVVRRTVFEMGGSLMLESEPGRGTRFTIQLPLTLAITDALIATVGDRTYAVPQGAVQEVMEVDAASIRQLENNEVIAHRDGVLPVLHLARLFGLPDVARPTCHGFVIGQGRRRVVVLVDRIVGQREIVVRTFSEPLIKVPGVGGATELGDGRIVLILDPLTLVRHAGDHPGEGGTLRGFPLNQVGEGGTLLELPTNQIGDGSNRGHQPGRSTV
jgi:two-component system chemotaxis sensor kinase CheA